jgi:hypothetical protein
MRVVTAALVGLLASGCAATAPAVKPVAKPSAAVPAPAKIAVRAAKKAPPPELAALETEGDEIVTVTLAPQDFAQAKIPLRPVSVDLSSLPRTTLPAPLEYNDRPAEMPAGTRAKFKTEDAYGRTYDSYRSLYLSLEDAPIARLQIGSVLPGNHAAAKAYATCYDNYPTAIIQPARWETITTDADGAVHYSLTDAWFDGKECAAVALQTVDVKPAPIAGGLMYAFIDECKSCGHPRVILLAPGQASAPRATALGGESFASVGAFTVIALPLRHGGSASFSARLSSPGINDWLGALKRPKMESQSAMAVIGFDVAQTVNETSPTAVVYATLIETGSANPLALMSSFMRPPPKFRPGHRGKRPLPHFRFHDEL